MTGRLLLNETPEFSSIFIDQLKIQSFDLPPTISRCQSRKFSVGRKEKNSSSQILRHNILRKSLFLAARRRVYGNWTLWKNGFFRVKRFSLEFKSFSNRTKIVTFTLKNEICHRVSCLSYCRLASLRTGYFGN